MSQLSYLRSGFLLRWVALIIDVIVVGIVLGGALALAGMPLGSEDSLGALDTTSAVFVAGAFGIYWTVADGSKQGRTVGKHITRLRVVTVGGAPLDKARAAVRAAFRAVPLGVALGLASSPRAAWPLWALLLFDHLWALVDPSRRTLHDRVAGSVVVDSAGSSEFRFVGAGETEADPLWQAAWQPPPRRRWRRG